MGCVCAALVVVGGSGHPVVSAPRDGLSPPARCARLVSGRRACRGRGRDGSITVSTPMSPGRRLATTGNLQRPPLDLPRRLGRCPESDRPGPKRDVSALGQPRGRGGLGVVSGRRACSTPCVLSASSGERKLASGGLAQRCIAPAPGNQRQRCPGIASHLERAGGTPGVRSPSGTDRSRAAAGMDPRAIRSGTAERFRAPGFLSPL